MKTKIRHRTRRSGRNTEEEALGKPRDVLPHEVAPAGRLGTRIKERFEKIGLDADIPELRGQHVRLPLIK
jgi:antitoxin FitA